MTQLPIPVHVGSQPPTSWDDIETRQNEYGEDAAPGFRSSADPRSPALPWTGVLLDSIPGGSDRHR